MENVPQSHCVILLGYGGVDALVEEVSHRGAWSSWALALDVSRLQPYA